LERGKGRARDKKEEKKEKMEKKKKTRKGRKGKRKKREGGIKVGGSCLLVLGKWTLLK